ncbi:hypothetical protein J4E08_14055 [Sagittula sp. NFXS13]|uniref:hypothetical protein n=1 Tax=Sagittula sp. NFXS13 TaxID=2819095 RepID=UPI0032DF4870
MSLSKAFVIALICGSSSAIAADFTDPTWPCVQRKVERLSTGLMWPHPIPESLPEDESVQTDIAALAEKLSLRSLTLEELEPEIAAFAKAHGHDPALLGLVFQDVFDGLSRRRTRIISGIGDFSLGQIGLSEKIEGARMEMDTQMTKDEPDFDRVDALEEQLDWDQTIYSDRQKSITYLCETPVLLERRLYGIAQLLAGQIE